MTSPVTRMPKGVTNAAPWQTLAHFGAPDPTWVYKNFDEFNRYAAADWTVTVTGTGTVAATAFAGGAIALTNSAGIADAIYMQHPVATHQLIAGKDHFFKFRGQLSDVTNCVMQVGLIATSTTPLTAADGIYFLKATGQANLTLVSVIGGVSTSVALPSSEALVNATPFELGFHVTPQGDIEAFFNPTTGDNPINSANGDARGYVAKLIQPGITQALLNLSMGILNSTAAARSLTADYILGASNR